MLKQLTIKNQTYQLPIYLPDATLGVVRNLGSLDLQKVGIRGAVVNTYHLRREPGIEVLKKIGGIKKLMNFSGLVASDSGGFQLFSLINKNPDLGKITDDGVILYSGPKKRKKILFTPEMSIQIQFAIGSDIMICLDDFSPPDADKKRIAKSVERTINWARRCKIEFKKQLKKYGFDESERPLLFGVIQGDRQWELRKKCAEQLLKIGFDGYGLGGWPTDGQGGFDYQLAEFDVKLTSSHFPKFALGVGRPKNIVELYKMGYDIFDCVLPTRDARHKRLYVFTENPEEINFLKKNIKLEDKKQLDVNLKKNAEGKTTSKNKIQANFNQNPLKNSNQTQVTSKQQVTEKLPNWMEYLYINRGKFKTDQQPISQFCNCETCQNYSRAYLHHLFKIQDGLAWRLATIHNLRFYSIIVEQIHI